MECLHFLTFEAPFDSSLSKQPDTSTLLIWRPGQSSCSHSLHLDTENWLSHGYGYARSPNGNL